MGQLADLDVPLCRCLGVLVDFVEGVVPLRRPDVHRKAPPIGEKRPHDLALDRGPHVGELVQDATIEVHLGGRNGDHHPVGQRTNG